MAIEKLSINNIKPLIELVLELWTDCSFDEEFEDYKNIVDAENEICYIVKDKEQYVAFVHISIRNDYVEGATELPVAYIEGIYVKPAYQQKGIGKELMSVAENWAIEKGLKQIASDSVITNLQSITFHTKVGFTEAERMVCFIKDLSLK